MGGQTRKKPVRRSRKPVVAQAVKARVKKIIAGLRAEYPDADCSLDYENPLQLLIATILSAQCTDERVNVVTPELFGRYPTAADLAEARRDELEEIIRSTGFFRNKAKAIQACCAALVAGHDGEIPASMEALTALEGVGRKTANVVLGTAFGVADGIVVDTHVKRISGRLGITDQVDPEKVEQDLMAVLPAKDWISLPHLLIWHGRATCRARSPDCDGCAIGSLCPSKGVA